MDKFYLVSKVVLIGVVALMVLVFFSPPSEPAIQVMQEQELREQVQGCSAEEVEQSLQDLEQQALESTGKSIGKSQWTQLKEYLNVMGKAKDLLIKTDILIGNIVDGSCMKE